VNAVEQLAIRDREVWSKGHWHVARGLDLETKTFVRNTRCENREAVEYAGGTYIEGRDIQFGFGGNWDVQTANVRVGHVDPIFCTDACRNA
jgi:hypothetical protein